MPFFCDLCDVGHQTHARDLFSFVEASETLFKRKMKKLTRRNWAGMAVGAMTGYLYYRFVGCSSGACLIASNAFISVPYGMFMGYLLSDLLKPSSKRISTE